MFLPVSARHQVARLSLIVSGCLLIAVFLVRPGRLNADILISDETTGTNGSITHPENPFILGENETLTVQAGGSITAAGLNSFAIYAGGTGEGGNTIILESGSFVENTLAWDYFSGAGIRIKGDERDDDIFGLTGNGPLDNGASNIVSISAGARLSTDSVCGIRADNNNYISQNGTLSTSGNFISGIHVNDNNEIQMSGSLASTGGTGIYANRNNLIDISGAINASGTNGAGIVVNLDNYITVTGTVEITASESYDPLGGQRSAGIYAGTDNTINVSGSISSSGTGSDAIRVSNCNTIKMSGNIITEGSGTGPPYDRGNTSWGDGGLIMYPLGQTRVSGIKADNFNTITVDGTIETFGHYAGGMHVGDGNVIDISGEINTCGRESEAVIINSDNQITVDGRLHTQGEGSGGIHAGGGNNYITLSGAVITEGEEADGIFADSGRTIEITDTGVIETFGEDASAIYTKGPTTIDMAGNISTCGDYTQSIYSRGTGTITVSGTINHEGFGGAGILAFYADEVNISGDINVTGNSFGINALDVTSITVSGSIETDGNYAIVTEQTEEINISGSVKTHGNYGYAVDTADRINLSGSIVTYGKEGRGLNAGSNFASISGSISTWGEGATAIDAGADASVTLSGYAGTSGSQAHVLLTGNKNIINVSGTLETSGEAADGIRLSGGGNVVYLTGLLSSTGPDGYALNSDVPVYFSWPGIFILPGTEEDETVEPQAYYTQNVVHLLNGASVNGGIINSTTTEHNSFLTFGYVANMDGTADLSGVDQDFNLTMNDGITSTTAAGWKGYFAGGTTTLKGATNQFSDLFIGSSTFDGARIPAGSGGETTLDALDGPGANLKVTQAVATTGKVAVGKNSRYTLSGTHTHTGGDVRIDGTLSLVSGTLDSSSAIVNTGRMAGNGDIAASTLSNTGEMEFTQGRSTVRGNTTNAGTILNNGGEVHFKGDYLEQGTFYSDQGDTYMDNVTVDENGALVAGGSDPEALARFFIAGDFVNYSTRTTEWDTINVMLTFTGGDNGVHNLFSAGVATASPLDGFNDNFAWGNLTLGDDVEMLFLLDGNEDSQSTAFYTEIITGIKFNAQGQIINVCGDMNLYYLADLDGNDYLGGISYDFATGSGQLIAVSGVSSVPLPGSLILLASGLLVAAWQRRRRPV
nr:PEP-CTERM sorting domain-containing protein [uncultured Desulfobacter sp.]